MKARPNPPPHGGLLIEGARVLDPASGFDAAGFVGIRDGRIVYVGKSRPKFKYAETLNARGNWLIPGIVDLAARFREPGQTAKATIVSEIRAAQAGGITTAVLPPDTLPAIDSPAVVDRIQGKARAAGGLDLRMIGALTKNLGGEALAEMSALRQAGCVGVGNAHFGLRDSLMGRRALEYAQGLGLTVHVFAQNPALANGGCAHEGPVATRLGLPPIPVAADVSAIRFWMSRVEDTGARVHVGRLSTARGAEMVAAAQKRKLPVTADVAVHQLFLTDADVEGFNPMAHVIPPLRSADDRDALREAVRKGVIGAICSDHQPHEADAKVNPFPLTEPGISALETLLPLSLQLVHEHILSPSEAVARLTSGPARILGIEAGSLAVGSPAHLTLIDPEPTWTLDAAGLLSAGRNTPFHGRTFSGRVVRTLFRGETVFSR